MRFQRFSVLPAGPSTWAILALALAALPSIQLPGGRRGIGFDDLVYSPDLSRVLVPAGRTGRLFLVDPATGAVESIEGFAVSAAATRGHGDGTTSADFGLGTLFAIDRTRGMLVAADPAARRIVAEVRLGGEPDYVRWVAPRQEVWVTEPGRIETFLLEPGPLPLLVRSGDIAVEDGPESLVIDPARHRAYTNTRHHSTVAIDLDRGRVVSRWENGCAAARGLALDAAHGLLFVGCEEGRAVALDLGRGGAVAGRAPAGKGVDGIAFDADLSHLYLPAAGDAQLTVVGVRPGGALGPLGKLPTARGAHCAVSSGHGRIYVCDPAAGKLLVLQDPYPASR
jgi:hypothetical protein